MNPPLTVFWNLSSNIVLEKLGTNLRGLTTTQAQQLLAQYGPNSFSTKQRQSSLQLLLNQFKSPIIIILILAAILSIFFGDITDAIIILTIVIASGLLGFWQERGAANALEKLLAVVQTQVTVLRDGNSLKIPLAEIVPGDIVVLSAGTTIPGDCLILASNDLFLDEAALTGETFPVEKKVGLMPAETLLSQRTNVLFMGTHVVSGNAQAVVVHTATRPRKNIAVTRGRLGQKKRAFNSFLEHMFKRQPLRSSIFGSSPNERFHRD